MLKENAEERAVSIVTLATIRTKDKWQVFKGPRGVLMFSLCFLASTEKVSGDGRKNSHEREITERDRGRERERPRERERWKLVLADQCECYCLFCFFVHKGEGRREKASDAHEQCLGPLCQMSDHKLGMKVTALLLSM